MGWGWASRTLRHAAQFWLAAGLLCTLTIEANAAGLSAAQPNNIVPDGRTKTQITTSGSTSTITTGTVSGSNAVNSFSTFTVGQGNTVNLIVPSTATTLINLVRNAPVAINGVLNSYKNGKIGGNVYFADPFGFVVGKTGAINTGSLSVSTPTSAFLDSVIGPNGAVNDAAVGNLLSGNIPISGNGVVSIEGSVNAQEAVRILAQQVSVEGQVDASHAAQAQQLLFSASVNGQGLQKGAGIVSKGGVIEIVAAGDVSLNGSLAANDSNNSQSGAVQVLAQHNINIESNAALSASARNANNKGGNVRVYAGNDLTVSSGAQLLAKASGTGNGGAIEASATGTATIKGGLFDASSPAGRPGSVLFDPTDLDYAQSVYTNGADFTATADNSITVESGAEINTRNVVDSGTPTAAQADSGPSIGDSGNITLSAPAITIKGSLRADADPDFASGTITLNVGSITIDGQTQPGIDTHGASLAINATGAIALNGTGYINTQQILLGTSTSDSGSVTLSGGSLSIGGQGINASALNSVGSTFSDGPITLSSGAALDILAAIRGGAITINAPSGTVSVTAGIDTNGQTATIAANNINIEQGAYINTRQTGSGNTNDVSNVSSDDAGNIILNAPTITLAGSLNAFAINSGGSTFK